MHPLIAKAKLEAAKEADAKVRGLIHAQLHELSMVLLAAQQDYGKAMHEAGYCAQCDQSLRVCTCPIVVMG